LTRLDAANRIGLAVDGSRRTRELWRFACEGHLGELTREHAEKVAELEAELTVTVDGDSIPFRMIRPTMANEPDRSRRERLERARNELVEEHLNPLHLDALARIRGVVADLGAPNYLELYRRFGYELDDLAEQCREVLAETERLYEHHADRLFRERVGIGLDEARRFDVARLFRAPEWDPVFPGDRMLPALESTLADLGIDLRSQQNVHLDLDERPQKSPRAFCAPIEVPGKVMLVIQPIGGVDDWRALFHEAGHTEHFAHTSASLSVEERRLGDNAVTEGYAMLLEYLTAEPSWLSRRLDFPRPAEFAAEEGIGLLYFVRRYSAKLLYEIEFHAADDPTALKARYVELLGDALKIDPSEADYLGDMDGEFYVTAYLRSWAFEAQLRAYLRERYGSTWFARREAGSLLREMWEEGQRPTADELLKDVTGSTLEMHAVVDRVRELLS
jgi:oligoendopeptidase F